MTGTEDKKLEEMTVSELLKPFFICAKITMKALSNMLPPGAEFTLLVRFPKEGNAPLLVGTDDLNEVEKTLHAINNPENKDKYHVEYMNPAMQGRPN